MVMVIQCSIGTLKPDLLCVKRKDNTANFYLIVFSLKNKLWEKDATIKTFCIVFLFLALVFYSSFIVLIILFI